MAAEPQPPAVAPVPGGERPHRARRLTLALPLILLLGIVGAAGYLSPGSPGAVLHGELERAARSAQINTFGGGVNEIQREILAMAGLGMKRGAR